MSGMRRHARGTYSILFFSVLRSTSFQNAFHLSFCKTICDTTGDLCKIFKSTTACNFDLHRDLTCDSPIADIRRFTHLCCWNTCKHLSTRRGYIYRQAGRHSMGYSAKSVSTTPQSNMDRSPSTSCTRPLHPVRLVEAIFSSVASSRPDRVTPFRRKKIGACAGIVRPRRRLGTWQRYLSFARRRAPHPSPVKLSRKFFRAETSMLD